MSNTSCGNETRSSGRSGDCGDFVKTPIGFITAVYGFLVAFWGAGEGRGWRVRAR